MNHYYCLAIFVACLPFANLASMPWKPGCDSEYDSKECLIRVYCYNKINYWNYNGYDRARDMYNSICFGPQKVALVYNCDNVEEVVPVTENQRNDLNIVSNYNNLKYIYLLDLSHQNHKINPKLSEMDGLNYLDLSHNYITIAKLTNDYNLISLKEINFSYNEITSFNVTGEYKYKTLTTLIVSHNEIKTLPDGVFEGYSKLSNLDLSYNRIEKLQIETFEGIKGLLYLNLSHNEIDDINTSMFRFKNLKYLNLSYNKIQSVNTQNFLNLQNLEKLDISFNSIIRIENTIFRDMPFLKSLNLANNNLEIIDKDIFLNNSRLSDVDLSCNHIHSLQKDLFKDKNITSFSIKGNLLKGSIEKGVFAGLTFVTHLNLSYHLLTSIQDFAFFGLQNLNSLLISNNKIDLLTKKSFRTMFKLMYLDLSNNKIADLSFEKDDLISLRHLLLQNNYLFQINYDDFNHLNTLNILNIAQNNISKMEPRIFKSLQDLSHFEISNNPLRGSIEEGTFNGLSSLPKLDISGTKLTTIANNSFNGMILLLDFNASHGLIDTIEYNTFMNTGQLKSIDLSYNRISTFLLNSSHLPHLTTLILNNNLLAEITDNTFKGFYNLEIVNLGNNIIHEIENDVFEDQINLHNLVLSYNKAMRFNVSFLKYNKILNTLLLSGLENQICFTSELIIPIKLLQLADDGIKNISTLNLKTLFQLEKIILKYNNISTLNIGDFSGLISLRSLDLSYNKITVIQPGVFEYNNNLILLNISYNMLSELNYGIFQGLVNLRHLDLSTNYINDLKSERFYELPNLYELIVDNNKIDSFVADDFNALGILSIGENPLPCDLLIKLNKVGMPFELTAVNIVKKGQENFHGITCNTNKNSVNSSSSNLDFTKFSGNDRILIEIRDELVKIANGQRSDISDSTVTARVDNNSKYNFDLSEKILNKNIEQLTQLTNFSGVMIKETNKTNILLQNILKKIGNYQITTTKIPFTKENATLDNILPYINRIKQEMEDFMASEKQNIMEDMNSKLSSLKASIENEKVSTVAPTPELSQQKDYKEKSGSLFTEICVSFILVILVGYILYKFYKSKLFIRPRRSSSTRGLEIPNL